MEVLANGMKVNFWVPVEEEPDIDRFVDEQIMVDLDRFMLVGTLIQVKTCKKKNEEKEWDYYKQITVEVNNICLASDNNFNIQVPGKKDEFLYEVKFRYAPEPVQDVGDMGPIEQAANAAEADAADNADVVHFNDKAKKATKIADTATAAADAEKKAADAALNVVVTGDAAAEAEKKAGDAAMDFVDLAEDAKEKAFLADMQKKEKEMDDTALNGAEIHAEVAHDMCVEIMDKAENNNGFTDADADNDIVNQNAADAAAEVDADIIEKVIKMAGEPEKEQQPADAAALDDAHIAEAAEADAAMDDDGDFDESMFDDPDVQAEINADLDENGAGAADDEMDVEGDQVGKEDEIPWDDDPEDAADPEDTEPDPDADNQDVNLDDDEGINWGD